MNTKYYLFQNKKAVFRQNTSLPEPVTESEYHYFFARTDHSRIPLVKEHYSDFAVELSGDVVLPATSPQQACAA